jgi:autotransporter-associated beta strand protein
MAGMPAIALATDSWSISIGVRETGTSAAIGDDGGNSGGIEWVNLDGQSIIADGLWHQYTWNFGTDPVTNFSGGNGVLSSATMKGVLENIRITNSGGNTGGAINLRVDNIVNTVGGVPMTVAGFETSEGFSTSAASTTPMFREPLFSSTTLGNMSTGLNSTLVSTIAHDGSQSMAARWSFVPDGSTSRWLRLSTASGGGNIQPNPTINFAPGNSVSMWLRANVVNPSGTRAFGVDVSSNQGTGIDWNRVAQPASSGGGGLKFAFVRSPRGGTSGTSTAGAMRVDDSTYNYNITNAKSAGLLTGAYHFGRPDMWTAGDANGLTDAPGTIGTPEDEARHMLEVAGKSMKVGYMRPVYDLEDGGAEQNVNQMSNFVHRFANTLMKYKGPGAKIIVYAGQSYSVSEVNSSVSTYPLWRPQWPSDPDPWAADPTTVEANYGAWDPPGTGNPMPWSFWQYNSPDVYIPGIGGASGITHNDIDVAHGDVNFVKGFLIKGSIWDGSSSATWATAANWDTNAEPTSTTELLFDGPVPGTGSSITLSSGRAASGLYFAESYTLTGGSLALNDGRIDVDATKSATVATNLSTPNGFRKVGTGSLTHSSGTSTVTGIAQVLQGTMNVSGGSIAVSGNLLVNPELTQFDKSLVAPFPTVGQITNSNLTINGGSVSAAAAFVGGSETASGAIGTLNVSSGSLSVTGAMKIWNSAVSLVNSKVNFSGGSMSLGSLNTDGDAASFNWTGGTLTIGGNNSTSALNSTGSGSASLVKTGSGTLTLSSANTYTGGTTVNAGLLVVSGATAKLGSGSVTVLDPGTGAGGGLRIQTGVLNAIGDNATLSLAGGSTPDVADVGFAFLEAGVNDRIAALVLGGVLQVNGLTYGSTASGALFKSDEYFSVGGSGILSVGQTGDYNGDGSVNAADYVVWRKSPANYGGNPGYDLWRANFGQTSGSGAGATADSLSSAVPEPSPLLLLALAATSVCLGPHRKVTQVPKVQIFWQAVRP